MQPRGSVGHAHGLALEPPVKIDAHPDGRIALRDIERNLRRGIGEEARIGRNFLDERESLEPAGAHRGVLIAGRGIKLLLHLLLDNLLKGLGCGAAFRRIGEGDLADQRRIGQSIPRGRDLLHAEARERIGVVANAKTGNDGADPQALRIPEGFAGDFLRNNRIREPLGPRGDHAAIDEATGLGLLDKVISTAAEKQVNADSDIGGKECPLGRLGRRVLGGIVGKFERPVVKAGIHIGIPFFPERVDPMVLEGCGVFGSEIARDFRGAAGNAPIEGDIASGSLAMVATEGDAELVTDGLVVRGDDDETIGAGFSG